MPKWTYFLLLPLLAPVSFSGETKVNLFGQPCLIKGPFQKSELEIVHELSPAQLPEIRSAKVAQHLLDKIDSTEKKYPKIFQSLGAYFGRLKNRISTQKKYFEAFDSYLKNSNQKQFKDAVEKLLPAAAKEGVSKHLAKPSDFTEYFHQNIEPVAETLFHRLIKAADIQYECQFEG